MKFSYCRSVRRIPLGLPVETIIAVADGERLRGDVDRHPAGQVLAVEERDEAFFRGRSICRTRGRRPACEQEAGGDRDDDGKGGAMRVPPIPKGLRRRDITTRK